VTSSKPNSLPLRGLTIGIAEHRYGREFGALMERLGANLYLCPLIEERPVLNHAEVQGFVRAVVSGELGMMIFLTGVGARFLVEEAERMDLKASFLAALAKLKVVARGPKPVAFLHRVGIRVDMKPETPTSEGVVETLRQVDLRGTRVGVQLYGVPNPVLCDALRSLGADVVSVQVYHYGPASAPTEIRTFIGRILDGSLDVVAFTSAPQVRALFEAGEQCGLVEPLRGRLQRGVVVASIGSVTGRALEERGIVAQIVPQDPSLAAFSKAVAAFFETKASRVPS